MHRMLPSSSIRAIAAEKRGKESWSQSLSGPASALLITACHEGNVVLLEKRRSREIRCAGLLSCHSAPLMMGNGLPQVNESHSERAYPVKGANEAAHVTGHGCTPTAAVGQD